MTSRHFTYNYLVPMVDPCLLDALIIFRIWLFDHHKTLCEEEMRNFGLFIVRVKMGS